MRINFIFSALLLVSFSVRAAAGWWIFGQGANEVKINYIYVAGASMDEAGPRVKLPRSSLAEGKALIKGRASVRKGNIGAVLVSLTEPEDWKKAKLSADGTFEFSFAPETGKAYKFSLKAMDTAGKTNDITATAREIEFTDMDIRAELVKALDYMIAAYQAENPAAFMAYVAPDFAGDAAILDTAVRKDFTALSEIRLAYTLSGIASGQAGRTSVTLNYRRQVIASRDGKPYSDSGTTEFVFKQGEKGYKVYSMKNPLIFGLSLASDVGTGTVTQGPDNVDIIVIPDGRTVTTAPPGTTPEPYLPISASGSKTITPGSGIFFASGLVDGTTPNPDMFNGPPNIINFRPAPAPGGAAKYKAISGCTGISDITSVDGNPANYISPAGATGPAVAGACYAVYLAGSATYAAFEITGISPLIIRYKYQPNGTNLF